MFNGYRVGWPLWRTVARLGVTLRFRAMVHFDEESKTFWADSPDIDGLIAAGNNLPELQAAVMDMASDLLDLEMNSKQVHARPQYGIEGDLVHA